MVNLDNVRCEYSIVNYMYKNNAIYDVKYHISENRAMLVAAYIGNIGNDQLTFKGCFFNSVPTYKNYHRTKCLPAKSET